ncbi:MAG TPA: M48 family metalloprotease, partial [Candidatus Binatia bacterium]|nr:M48 family metalloprotease [Candidatus Binatia bacterium]
GHVHARDSMVGLYRNMGLGIFLEAVTGGSGVAQQLVLLGGQLAELRFTRAQEERADAFALRLMADAGYNPEALARAFEAIEARAEEMRESDIDLDVPDWMLTHPNIDARIAAARAAATPARGEALTPDEWNSIRGACAADVGAAP